MTREDMVAGRYRAELAAATSEPASRPLHPDPPERAPLGATSSPELRRSTLHEAKLVAAHARYDTGVTYEAIAYATGRHRTHVYDAMDPRNDVRTLSHSDLLAMSRNERTRAFVARLLVPIIANLNHGQGKE